MKVAWVFIVFLLTGVYGQALGQYVAQVPLFNDIVFTDSLNGWLVGQNGLILHTDDGGLKWKAQASNLSVNLVKIQFTSSEEAWIIGNGNQVLFTKNKGSIWEKKVVGETGYLFDLFFLNRQIGWIVGSDGIFKSVDGGKTWKGISANPRNDIYSGINKIKFWNDSVGWGYGSNGNVYRTTDGGNSWTIKCTNKYPLGWYHSDEYFESALFSSSRAVIIGAGSNHYDICGFVVETRDGGDTWSEVQVNWLQLRDLIMFDTTAVAFGYAVTSFSFDNTFVRGGLGVMYCRGFLQDPSYPNFYKVSFLDSQNGWAIERDAKVYRTRDSGLTWHQLSELITSINDEPRLQPNDNFQLYQNYPNPFNAETIIEFNIPSKSDVHIGVFDMLGREMKTLVDEVKEPGSYRARFNGDFLTSGIYFYRLRSGNLILTKKLILLK